MSRVWGMGFCGDGALKTLESRKPIVQINVNLKRPVTFKGLKGKYQSVIGHFD